ncbi:Acetyl esterase/lipase [Leifsonia sp. 98AMF]|nr:Acetyl esterase/lipase [Leifsonia sp. 197AMF]SDI83519.1 Acetyl esterase/lipase [Leifsonia sp. 466MF]SDK00024.1 Acetyl esterase/lipase [Leifsonia sp. 157MF]SDN86758.1 Acetyl esterase/lipase [Leifsonia sp. 509MF]SEN19413.1 Acetyl esterase/lipase [Leifsonia sp. 467MF]SFL92780.1 Acetyl esterase/lipase [Leifsonia sp. 98AMF]
MEAALAVMRARQRAAAAAVEAGQAQPTPDEARASFVPGDTLHPLPADVRVTDVDAGGVAAHWLDVPGENRTSVLVFLHGGGFQLGSLASDGELAARLGRAAGMRVLFVDYRLAPEHPFPAALDDARTAWEWLCVAHGSPPMSVAFAGDSAGGGLALSTLVAARDAGEPLPAAVVLMSPTVDLTGSGPSMRDRVAEDPVSTPQLLARLAVDYLDGVDPRTPAASPLFASLAGLPPLHIEVGTADLLLSDAERLAAAATAAGVEVQLVVGQGLPHVFPLLLGTPEAQDATERIARFLRERVEGL